MAALPHFTRSLLARSLVVWAFVRLAVAAGKPGSEARAGLTPSHPLELTPPAALLVVGLVAVAGYAYARRRNEDLFLLCLGYDRLHLAAMLVLPALLLEIAVGVAVRP